MPDHQYHLQSDIQSEKLECVPACAGAALPASIKSLWGPTGTFAGTPAAYLGINDTTLQQLYGPEALKRAKTWVTNKKMLWLKQFILVKKAVNLAS